ncbi:hypothetical protein L202_06405 [Cryptococcus amylolentus CBS 6039]|uniref:CAAX prenyl protease n=2 Tax=Cryptococcus amylolentus TaxID=104669 RepID=A0A1E3HFT0_9TREE|nr:hypothetical protein L202_06405 [Cryptococcus amylolentus CBS 6039]ODN75208.1 hypothetical protein L202_06405 [Cryptococcus amylolentus CBS 6039]ODO02988.1 hypothetical protein I350_05832 [Cryptococcus amylolentus CBS 6273]
MSLSPVAALNSVIDRLSDLADTPAIDYKALVILSTWIQTGFEVYILQVHEPIEDSLKGHLDDETFRKAQVYSKDKTRYLLAQVVFNQLLGWGLIKTGVYAKLWDVSGTVVDSFGLGTNWVIIRSLVWVTILTLTTALPSIPWSYYYTFVIESKHGFNKSSKGLWIADTFKTYALVAALGLPVLSGFLRIIEYTGKTFVPWLMLFLVGIQLTLQIVYPLIIQPLFNKLEPLPEGELRTQVEALAGELGFPLTHLYVIDGSKRSSHSNAYFYGLPWSKHIVIYDTLIKDSTTEEVVAVLAHELGHWKFTHPTKLLLATQVHLFLTLTIFSIFINNRSLYSAFGFDPSLAVTAPQPFCIGFILFQLVLEPTDAFVKFLLNAQTRRYEYQADEFAVGLGKKAELAEALIKLHVKNLSSPHSDWLYSMYHHSHPTLPERLTAMDKYEEERVARVGKEGKKDL